MLLLLAFYVISIIVIWYMDAELQANIWQMADPDKKKPGEFHLLRVAILLIMSVTFIVGYWSEFGWYIILITIAAMLVGIVIYEFRYCYIMYGDWKFYKHWGYQIGKWSILYPNWKYMIAIMFAGLVSLGVLVKRIDERNRT